MSEKKLKEQIKEVSKWIRQYKKEQKALLKTEGREFELRIIEEQLGYWQTKLDELENKYKKGPLCQD